MNIDKGVVLHEPEVSGARGCKFESAAQMMETTPNAFFIPFPGVIRFESA